MAKITLEEDVVEILFGIYRDKGHPLGKNRRGRKKWITNFVIGALKRLIEKENLDNTA